MYIRFGYEDIEHIVKGYVYSDGCYCPQINVTQWFDSMECSSSLSLSQLRADLKPFDKIDMNEVINKAKEKYFPYRQSYAICHYVIKDNKVKRGKQAKCEVF